MTLRAVLAVQDSFFDEPLCSFLCPPVLDTVQEQVERADSTYVFPWGIGIDIRDRIHDIGKESSFKKCLEPLWLISKSLDNLADIEWIYVPAEARYTPVDRYGGASNPAPQCVPA